MSTSSKLLVAIFLIQVSGLVFLAQIYGNLQRPDEEALSFGKERVFQGEAETKFVFAVSQTRRVVETTERAFHIFFGLGITISVLTFIALVLNRGTASSKSSVGSATPESDKKQ